MVGELLGVSGDFVPPSSGAGGEAGPGRHISPKPPHFWRWKHWDHPTLGRRTTHTRSAKITHFPLVFTVLPPKAANPAHGTPRPESGCQREAAPLPLVGGGMLSAETPQLILFSRRNVSKSNQETRLSGGNKPPEKGGRAGGFSPWVLGPAVLH